jgi:GTP-binding protein HflX
MMPRMLTISHVADKQRGGNRNKGLGEKLLDLDKRRITNRILFLKRELEAIEKQKIVTSKQRNKSITPKVCLVGYTNAGKSSLMNALIELYGVKEDKKVFEKDMLFATLDTSTRKICINKKDIIISDTVGFVSLLPHALIESFKSTLSELRNADLLIHVIDASNPNYLVEKKVCEDTIEGILQGESKKIINVYSKIDLPTNNIIEIEDNEVFVSSKTREGMNELVELIFTTLYPNIIYHKLFIPYNEINVKKSSAFCKRKRLSFRESRFET